MLSLSLSLSLCIALYYVCRPKTLIAICCLDERVSELEKCLEAIRRALRVYIGTPDMIGVFREKDVLCQSHCPTYITVPDYTTPRNFNSNNTYERHNMDGILAKRNAALRYANEHHYKRLIFIDSDVLIRYSSLYIMMIGTLFADICCIPYGIRWANMQPVLGYANPYRISFEPTYFPYHSCQVAGMGCTALVVDSPRVPKQFSYAKILGIRGEDIGFFLHAYLLKARVWASNYQFVTHEVSK